MAGACRICIAARSCGERFSNPRTKAIVGTQGKKCGERKRGVFRIYILSFLRRDTV